MAQAQRLADDLKKAVAQAERARIERQSQLKLLEVEAAAQEAELQRDLDQAKTKLQKLARKRQDTVSAHERQQAQLNLMLEAREATTEKDEALRQCDALERRLHQAWVKEAPVHPGENHGKDLVACADSVGADAVESMLRAESVAMRTAIRFYEKQQEDSDVALEAQREREALWKLEDQQAEEAAELDAAEERLVLGEACIADAFSMVETADDFHDELADLAQALARQKAALEVAQERRDAWQDQASDLRHLLASAEARTVQLEKKLTSSSKSKAADALDALRQSGYQGAAALVVVLARLCGGPRLAFLAIDANNSGAVSTYEFDSALRMRLGLDYEAITGLKLRSLFKAFDTRHCGLVYGVDMVSAFADIWRAYGLPEEIARDPLLNPDLEGPAQDEVLREQQRWLMEARARSRRPRSSSPSESRTPRTPRTPRGGRDVSLSPRQAASPRELIRDEWQRGYHTVGIPLSPRSLKAQTVILPGVSPRSQHEDQRLEEAAMVMASSPKPGTLAALATQMRESPKAGSGPAERVLPVPKLRLQGDAQSPNRAGAMVDYKQGLQSRAAERARVEEIERQESRRIQSPNRAGAMADSKQVAAKHQQSLQSRAAERARVEEIERQESRRIQSPNRAGAMADSKQVAAKHQQSLQSPGSVRARVEEIEQQESSRIQSPNRAGATADSKQVAAKQQSQNRPGATASKQVAAERHQDLQPESEEGHEDYLDDLGRESGEVASEDDLLYPDSKHSAEPKPVHESQGRSMQPTQRRRSSEADGEHNGPRRGPVSAGGQSRGSRGSRDSGQAQQRHSQKESELAQRKSLETSGAKASQRSSAAKTSPNISRSEPGGAGQIPTPEVMSKAARARSLLYVAPKTQGTAPAATAEMSGSLSSTLGVSKKPSRSQPQSQNVQKVQSGKKSPNPTPATTLTEEELARRDSAPPSFLCGRSFGRSDGVLLPLRSKERHVHSLENSPSPTSERGLQDLTRGEQPQLLWERSLSPDARANRSSLISFGKPENFDTGDRSTASKSPGRPVTTSRSPSSRVSPRSHGTPSPMGRSGRSTSPYSNRAIYVSDTPWSRPPPSPVATKAWK